MRPGASFGKGLLTGCALPPQPTYLKRTVQGEVTEAWRSAEQPNRSPRSGGVPSAAQKAGLAYERRVQGWAFSSSWLGALLVSPWFGYRDAADKICFCQPDLLFDEGVGRRLVVCEVKLRWHPDAWWQVERLYRPVLAKVFPDRELISLCICRSFDPAVVSPGPVRLLQSLEELPQRGGQFSALVVR